MLGEGGDDARNRGFHSLASHVAAHHARVMNDPDRMAGARPEQCPLEARANLVWTSAELYGRRVLGAIEDLAQAAGDDLVGIPRRHELSGLEWSAEADVGLRHTERFIHGRDLGFVNRSRQQA